MALPVAAAAAPSGGAAIMGLLTELFKGKGNKKRGQLMGADLSGIPTGIPIPELASSQISGRRGMMSPGLLSLLGKR